MSDHYEVRHLTFPKGSCVKVDAGFRGHERVVPPAGEEYAFHRSTWARRVEVYVSPAGRSVRVFVDGEEVRR